jgi:hypothetical protein
MKLVAMLNSFDGIQEMGELEPLRYLVGGCTVLFAMLGRAVLAAQSS